MTMVSPHYDCTFGKSQFQRQMITYDCVSILDNIAKKTSCTHYISHGEAAPSPF